MKRLHEGVCVWRLEEAQLLRAVSLLATAVRATWEVDCVLGIARGGLVPAKLIASDLNRPLFVVRAMSNVSDDILSYARDEVLVDQEDLIQIPRGKAVLLVDDICGSGKTLSATTSRLGEISKKLYRVTLCRNEGSAIKPDMWVWSVRDWVIFPWESPSSLGTQLEVRRLPEANTVNMA